MVKLVKFLFRDFIGIVLWVNLIAFGIAGGIIGNEIASGGAVTGVFVGLVAGFFANIIGGGFIATVINIDESLEWIKKGMNFEQKDDTLEESKDDAVRTPMKITKYTSKDGFTYSECNGEITITGYSGGATSVVIPDRINNLPVTTIGGSSFAGKRLTNVAIPDTITCIEGSAFYRNKLTEVHIPKSVSDIGWGAFDFGVKVARR